MTIADVPSVTLEAPGEVKEGERVTVTARLSRALPGAVVIPLRTTRVTSESGDHRTLSSIRIASGETSGEGAITTREDNDLEDETVTMAVRSASLPSPLVAGDPSSVEVRIVDVDTLSIRLSASTLRPSEGSSVRLTATLSHPAPEGGVTLHFTATGAGDNPAAPITDYTLDPASGAQNATAPIEIAEGQRTARATLRVVNDTEPEDDEGIRVGIATETVLEKWPEPLDLTIPANDGGGGATAVAWLDAVPNPVEEGDEVEIDVWLSQALDADATIPLTVTRGTSEEGDHGTLDEVVVSAGSTRGTGTISTARDDADAETFSVLLGENLPAGVAAGFPDSVEITFADRGGDAPGRVRNLRVTPGDDKLDLAWSPPSTGTVDIYRGEYRERGAAEWTAIHESGGNYADTEAAVQGANGTAYDVRVRASNEYGVGPWATGTGTPTAGGGSSDLRSLGVRVSAAEDGSYGPVSLSPSFRSSATSYAATAPAGTTYAKFRPTSRTAVDLILVAGHEVASGAESPPVAVHHGVPVWIAVLPTGDGQPKEYSVTFTVPSASVDAVRGSVAAAADAALAVVGELSPEHAAGALMGERSLGEERREALDRLGNANGRYDVGDLLAWIERCRTGRAGAGRADGRAGERGRGEGGAGSPCCSPPRSGRATARASWVRRSPPTRRRREPSPSSGRPRPGDR